MAPRVRSELKSTDAIKTYRYLRIGMIGAVVLLGASIAIEHNKVGCWQTSISAYFYTPVRSIFVGAMIAVGLSLIVIKGQTSWEDVCLNMAGLLAPVVAVVPTTDVGNCWSVQPNPLPLQGGSLANWVVTDIHNNFYALLIAGAIGLLVALVIALFVNRGVRTTVERVEKGTLLSLAGTALALGVGWALIRYWSAFGTKAHGAAAVAMFVFLIGAVISKAQEHRGRSTSTYLRLYSAVAALMAIGGITFSVFQIGGQHTVFYLETFEIVLLAAFWIVQTVDNWDEDVRTP